MTTTTFKVKIVESYRLLSSRQFLKNQGAQRLDEDKLKENGEMREPLDVSLGQRNFTDHQAGYNGFKQLLEYLQFTSPNCEALRERINADIVSNPKTIETIGKWRYVYNPRPVLINALRKHGVIFLKIKENPNIFDEQDSDPAKNFKYLVTLDDDGLPRHHSKNQPILPVRAFNILKATFTDSDTPITVIYQAMADAVDSENNSVKIMISSEGKVNDHKINHFLSAKLTNTDYCLYGLRPMKTARDGNNHQTVVKYAKKVTAEIPAEAKKVVPYIRWNESDIMAGIYDVLAEVKSRLSNNEESLVIRLDTSEIEYSKEFVKPTEVLDTSFIRHFRNAQ